MNFQNNLSLLSNCIRIFQFQSINKGSRMETLNNVSSSGSLDRQKLYKMITVSHRITLVLPIQKRLVKILSLFYSQESLEGKKMIQLKSLIRKVCRSMNLTEKDVSADVTTISRIVSNIRKVIYYYYL